ncbi:MAG: hypothetical protein ACI8YC_001379 [Salibacteraceae bacterium]
MKDDYTLEPKKNSYVEQIAKNNGYK